MADLELMNKEEINDRQIVLSRGTKPSASGLRGTLVNHPGGTRGLSRRGHAFRAHDIKPLHMTAGGSIGLSEQSRQRRKALASAELFEDELDLFDDMEYAGEEFDSDDDDLDDDDDELKYAGQEFDDDLDDDEFLNDDDLDDDEFLNVDAADDDEELEFSNSKMDFAEGDIAHLNSNEKAELRGLMKELKSMEAEDDDETSLMAAGGNVELDDLLEDLREEFPEEEFAEGKRWDSFKKGVSIKRNRRKVGRGRKHSKRAAKLALMRGKIQRKLAIKEAEAETLRDQARRMGERIADKEERAKHKDKYRRYGKTKRRERAAANEEFPAWVEKEYAARTASEYHDMANYYTDDRSTNVNWSELNFPISMEFSLNEAQDNPEVAQWSLGKLLEHNEVIQKIFNSGEILGDVVMHTIRHNAPVSLGFTASMEGRKENVFYEPNTCPTEAEVDLVHTHVTKQIAGIPQIPGKETLRTRPDSVAATFLDRYGTDWNMDKIRKDAVVPAGEKNAMPSSRSPLVGYLVMERELLHPDLINARDNVPVSKEMAENAMDIIEAGHKQILRLNDLSNMHITAVRTTGSSWDDTTEVGNDLRLSSVNDKNRIIANRLASPIVVQGVLTVSRGKAQQIQPEQSLEEHNAEMANRHQAAVNEHQILAQVAAETVQAHDQKTYVDAAKKAGYIVDEQEPEVEQQHAEENYPQAHNVNGQAAAASEVHYIKDPVSGVIYQSVPQGNEAYQQQE